MKLLTVWLEEQRYAELGEYQIADALHFLVVDHLPEKLEELYWLIAREPGHDLHYLAQHVPTHHTTDTMLRDRLKALLELGLIDHKAKAKGESFIDLRWYAVTRNRVIAGGDTESQKAEAEIAEEVEAEMAVPDDDDGDPR